MCNLSSCLYYYSCITIVFQGKRRFYRNLMNNIIILRGLKASHGIPFRSFLLSSQKNEFFLLILVFLFHHLGELFPLTPLSITWMHSVQFSLFHWYNIRKFSTKLKSKFMISFSIQHFSTVTILSNSLTMLLIRLSFCHDFKNN